MNNMY